MSQLNDKRVATSKNPPHCEIMTSYVESGALSANMERTLSASNVSMLDLTETSSVHSDDSSEAIVALLKIEDGMPESLTSSRVDFLSHPRVFTPTKSSPPKRSANESSLVESSSEQLLQRLQKRLRLNDIPSIPILRHRKSPPCQFLNYMGKSRLQSHHKHNGARSFKLSTSLAPLVPTAEKKHEQQQTDEAHSPTDSKIVKDEINLSCMTCAADTATSYSADPIPSLFELSPLDPAMDHYYDDDLQFDLLSGTDAEKDLHDSVIFDLPLFESEITLAA